MKIAPLYHALKKEDWANPFIIHTGQHYDLNMSDAFFKDLNLPEPHIHLGIGSGSHAEQTGKVMIAYEKVLLETRPDLVVVVGDVNSTIACTLAAVKIKYPDSLRPTSLRPNGPLTREIHDSDSEAHFTGSSNPTNPSNSINPTNPTNRGRPLVGHLEAGLRSFDRTMPEEINRIVTDSLADILWTPSPDAQENLNREGIPKEKIQCVGNIMIDSLEMLREKIGKLDVYRDFDLKPKGYGLVTLHRPSNVDDPEVLKRLCSILVQISQKIPLVFPIHPRTRKNLEQGQFLSILKNAKGLFLPNPLSYIRFMNMVFNCRFVITDSGGIQEETTYLGIPCLTLRQNTERPITITRGTNQLCGIKDLEVKVAEILNASVPGQKNIELWDGKTAYRIVEFLKKFRQD